MKLPTSEPSRWTDTEYRVLAGAPLAARLLSASQTETFGFHMPGHQAGRAFSAGLAADLFRADTTELPATDDLNDPGPAVRAAQTAAAQAFGAACTFFLTGGSTQGIQTLMLAACGRGGRLLIGPSTHRGVLHAAALFDIRLHMIAPEPFSSDALLAVPDPDRSPLPAVSPAALGAALSGLAMAQQLPDAVLLTSPDYYGATADIRGLAAVCRRFGVPLLVDEAHGAHFAFAPRLMPEPALMQGAAAVVQSAHKTLPALTPAALLHLSHGAADFERLAAERVFDLLRCIRTSSPSLMIAATIDWARSAMCRLGEARMTDLVRRLRRFGERLAAECRTPSGAPLLPVSGFETAAAPAGGSRMRDPLRLVIDTRAVCPAPVLAEHLSARGIRIEFADPCRLVLIVSPFVPRGALSALADALIAAVPVCTADEQRRTADAADRRLRECWRREHPDLMPRVLLSGRTEAVSLADAAGRRLAAALTPYPPGIPILWPGDCLTPDDIRRLTALLDAGFAVEGVDGGPAAASAPGGAPGKSALSSGNKSCIISVIAAE